MSKSTDPLILGIETSGNLCSVALGMKGAFLSSKTENLAYGQPKHLMGFIEVVMKEAGVSFKQLTHLAVNRGPGSFTGLRVGLAVVNGFSLAGNIPILGLTGFQIWRSLVKDQPLLVALDTRRDDFFAALFKGTDPQPSIVEIMTASQIHEFFHNHERIELRGDKLDALSKPSKNLDALDLLQATFENLSKVGVFSPEPFYFRQPSIHGN